MYMKKIFLAVVSAIVLLAAFISCSTVNNLAEYRFGGTTVAGTLRTPPEPEIDGNYDIHIDANNPVLSFVSVATNLAKANQIAKIKDSMLDALRSVDVPDLVWDETYKRSLRSLSSTPAESVSDSDYIFDLEIVSYGIDADSANAAVKIEIVTTARLYSTIDRNLIWQRRVSVREPLRPEVFGAVDVVDTLITTAVLADLSEEELIQGFTASAREVAYKIARRLEDDIYRAVFR
jgi:hypothetical protein